MSTDVLKQNEVRNFNRRRETVFKKAFGLQKKFANTRISITIELDGRWWTYRSSESVDWPPSMAEIVDRKHDFHGPP
ncbi:hypothetical protein LTR28_007690, partial [Elasticomyces elasticus]